MRRCLMLDCGGLPPLPAQIFASLPGGKLMAPVPLMQTSILALLPTVTEPVVSAVIFALALSSVLVLLAGQAVPVESLGVAMVVVFPFNQVMVPPLASEVARSGWEPPPVLPLHPLKVTVLVMLPDSPVHLILAVAGCDADAGPEKPKARANGVATKTPAVANRTILERNMHLPPLVVVMKAKVGPCHCGPETTVTGANILTPPLAVTPPNRLSPALGYPYVGCCGQPGGESSHSSWRPYGVRSRTLLANRRWSTPLAVVL